MNLTESAEIPRREMVVFFIADTSGSMQGTKIESVNQSISEVLPIIEDLSSENPDAKIKVAALKFSSGVEWMYDEPKDASEFKWGDLSAGGLTDLGAACKELCDKLSKNAFLKSATGAYAPVIILLSDGEPTDDYMGGIGALRENKWFKHAIKIAIAIGNDANTDILKEFTGNLEAVFTVHNLEALRQIIRIVTVTSSTIASQSTGVYKTTKQDLANKVIKNNIEDIPGAHSAADDSIEPLDTDDEWD